MGWSVLLVFKPVMVHLSPLAIAFLVAEGLLYSGGTWFFAHDDKTHFHAIWHIFVLLGSMAHWSVVLCILLEL
jgi:hemolysin III